MSAPILIVEDDKLQQETLSTLLRRKLDADSKIAGNGKEALDILSSESGKKIKLVIMDLDMPVMDGMEALEIMRQQYPAIPVIMLTGSNDIDKAVQAMKLGAIDFLTKPYEGERMVITLKNALKLSTLTREVSRLKSEKEGKFSFTNLIGHDGGLLETIRVGQKAAASDIPVLITGETGTGKEIFARAIHGESTRAGQAFIAVNCGAIPAQLVESTLFGHEKGAFTGATEKVIGKFREADGGTIFLDEVGELPLDTQVKLLRVLQQKEVEPVGAGKPVSVNVRIISATNRDLQKEVETGNFREDLYFRLNVLQLAVPPLRERSQDIPHLIRHFIERHSVAYNKSYKEIDKEAENILITHPWPGNVRQLENTINRALVISDGEKLRVQDFSELLEGKTASLSDNLLTRKKPSIDLLDANGHFKTAEDIEQEAMIITLNHFDQNITAAAKALGMAKSTFYRKVKSVS